MNDRLPTALPPALAALLSRHSLGPLLVADQDHAPGQQAAVVGRAQRGAHGQLDLFG